jgi:hypothetical protein
MRFGGFDHFFWWEGACRGFVVLAYHPVVAELASEVTANRSYRHNQRSGIEVA